MNSSNFNKFIEDFSSITSSDTTFFERILRKHPYFQTAALFLAKSNPIQHNTQMAALRSADRRVLRTWLDEEYRKELEREKQDVEAKQAALELENDENRENLDTNINTESINAFDKLVGTSTTQEKIDTELEEVHQETKITTENRVQKTEHKEDTETPINGFFDEMEESNSITKIENIENKGDSFNFFDDLENNEELEKRPTTTGNSDANFFDQVDKINENDIEEPIFKEQSAINAPLLPSPLSEIPTQTTDANFFDEIESDDDIFGDAQKDLDNYAFPYFEDEKEETEKNEKVNENKKADDGGSFFDDI